MPPKYLGGLRTRKIIATADNNAQSIKSSPSSLYGYELYNAAAYAVYVHFYDQTTSPAVGTDVPKFTIAIPPGVSKSIGLAVGVRFDNGIALSITKGAADTDNTAVVAGDVVGFVATK